MPIHDWTRVDVGLFHDFHFGWIATLSSTLNQHVLPSDHYALITPAISLNEYHAIRRSESIMATYRRRKNTIAIHHGSDDRVVAMIEFVSPANKSSTSAVRSLIHKARTLLDRGVHLLLVDLFPSVTRDPHGGHKAIWEELGGQSAEPAGEKPLTLAALIAESPPKAYIESVAVGDELPSMPIFLTADISLPAPLEATYLATWAVYPEPLRELLEPVAE